MCGHLQLISAGKPRVLSSCAPPSSVSSECPKQKDPSRGGGVVPSEAAALYSEEEAEVQGRASRSARGETEPPAVCLICQLVVPRSSEGSQLALGALQTPLGGQNRGGAAFGWAVLLVFLPTCSEAGRLGHWHSSFLSVTAAIVSLLLLGRARRHGAPWPGRVTRKRCECGCLVGPGRACGRRGVDSLDKYQETLRTWAGEWVPRWRESQVNSGNLLATSHLPALRAS